ncbi:hypothetical protein [Actinoallomurus iriomotensis]|nr:hypothetical protein [Actinoallomurus iriomotensis]
MSSVGHIAGDSIFRAAFRFLRSPKVGGKMAADGVHYLKVGKGSTRPLKVTLSDGARKIYKVNPRSSARASVPTDGITNREVAAYRLDRLFGFDLVPKTEFWAGKNGRGSLQDWVKDVKGGLSVNSYEMADRERMAIFDYVAGNTDRHSGNYLTRRDNGRPLAIDHGYCFPSSDKSPIISDFVADRFDRPISDEVIAQVRSVSPQRLADELRSCGLDEDAVAGAAARLREVQQLEPGRIQGTAWPGMIQDSFRLPVRRVSVPPEWL